MDFSWIKEPTLLAALVACLIIIGVLVKFLYSMWKKFEDNKKEVSDTILKLTSGQTDVMLNHNKQLVDVIDRVNYSLQQMTLTSQSAIELNKSVKESTDQNAQATREMKDFLTNILVKALQDKNSNS